MIDQEIGERRADQRAAAKAHDGHAGRHAAPVREPFDQGRHRRDIAKAKTDAADDAEAKPEQPELVDIDGVGADQKTAAPAESGDDARLARTRPFEPAAEDGRRQAEKYDAEFEHDEQIADAPVAAPA